ncbi:Coenzyme F420 hydrogenase/dehydrogenase, beta subunit C-terminal domain [Desulfofustis glycolicus]|uniref:Coenzyme F420-reducing hydrogenase, beta subunit n=1 Tax=Desulfofustis glycolicus DSM 9705 TaxID=1121409 RepID=A0A1M5YVQ4_9BACT|nr:Coenzyme F420 hydrogenase/dehydrogenase, beta subunit C-terminal domain [Desulfofustis glycolicus]SHI15940.1 Coenzyme F420-reducing hydrogenase, beta subunit [Desulfofustis glycolicus DSM 9705]
MITKRISFLTDKDCCGCGVCAAVCPIDCITLVANDEGFLYPDIDGTRCTDCGLCTKVCPLQHNTEIYDRISPPQVYAAWNLDDDIRRQSSSGGVFSVLAGAVLKEGGVVAGAAFAENMVCRHILVDEEIGLASLRGSKYVQSEIPSELFQYIRSLLDHGRHVFFTGTPCQVAGLRNFVVKDFPNLLCADLVCHGVPSPAWFRKFINESQTESKRIINIDFRNKEIGWNFSTAKVKTNYSDGTSLIERWFNNSYMVSFSRDYALRESCYACKFTTTCRQGDLTLADYWKVAMKYPEYDTEDKGTSLVLVNSRKGQAWLTRCQAKLFIGTGDLEHAILGNPMLVRPASRPIVRNDFYRHASEMSVNQLRRKYQLHRRPIWRRILAALRRRVKRLVDTSV